MEIGVRRREESGERKMDWFWKKRKGRKRSRKKARTLTTLHRSLIISSGNWTSTWIVRVSCGYSMWWFSSFFQCLLANNFGNDRVYSNCHCRRCFDKLFSWWKRFKWSSHSLCRGLYKVYISLNNSNNNHIINITIYTIILLIQ